jgi:hypothetical protein
MNAAQALKEMIRQYEEVKKLHENASIPIVKTHIESALDVAAKGLESIRKIAEINPDAEIQPALEDFIASPCLRTGQDYIRENPT